METLDLTSVARADLALFLDIDGTLIEHQSHPTGAKPDSELLHLLQDAHRQLGGALALVTGRSIEMVDAMFEPLVLPVAGIYGLEHRLPGEPASYAAEPPDLAAVADALGLPALAPRVLRLDPDLPMGYARDLEVLANTLPPERHLGYAVQWFALSAAVLVIALLLTLRARRRR